MTDDRVALLELIERSADADLVREMLSFAAERLMEAEVRHAIRSDKCSATAIASGVGRPGRIELEIPRLRRGSYFPAFLEPRRTAET